MNYLFVHNNFPAQFRHLAAHLASDPANEVRAIGADTARPLRRVVLHRYAMSPGHVAQTHPFARRFDNECRRAEQVLYVATMLAETGFSPDVVVAHSGWGEALPLRAVFPEARIVNYCEYFYRSHSSDVNFDPEFPALGLDGLVGLHARNAMALLGLADADLAISPTRWQRSTFPAEYAGKIAVAHEGVDTDLVAPDPDARLVLDDGTVLTREDEVLTFVARNLEPLRGYHVLMRALPAVMAARPKARVVVVGAFGVSYGQRPPEGQTWHRIFLEEVRDRIDLDRLHFLGHLPYERYLDVLRVSRAHAYLTYPFVLSWSCLEAMAASCVMVASDTAPVREVIDASTGILVPFHEPARLADALIDALAHPERHAEKGRAARARIVRRYDLRSVCLPRLTRLLAGAGEPAAPRPAFGLPFLG
ncbi:glycosyltransferase [Aureimonas leprariae]|uniref:Glycosyltransferase n=1 Tax=Plantimonas leprariae TaxID=2615207 RepID=A0A7V7PN47_9HYPH|nr:glycosyltransferase [Aureimonas leprariae]KAB0679036.1 glycosyltransferase [Aureimonas leprariae]